jgi:uncharacterized protein
LIDTSTNYTDGASERLVGSMLAELEREGRLAREAVVVVSKIGYVQEQNLALALEREQAGSPFPEMVQYMDGCWHCIHPAFLQDQLARSLDRLQLQTLDICLLHNPEYFLSDAKRQRRGLLPDLRQEFYRRVREAFAFLEAQVAEGRIGCYGVSSNTAVAAADDPEATSLSPMLEAAQAAGGPGHHFRVLQVPMNLFEADALLHPNTGPEGRRTVLEAAQAAGLGVLVNRPLNASAGERMVRLAEVPADIADAPLALEEALRRVGALEEEFGSTIAPSLQTPEGGVPPSEWFAWANRLEGLTLRLQGLEHWEQIETGMISPMVSQVVSMLDLQLSGPVRATWEGWRERYLPALEALLAAFQARAARQSQAASNQVAATLNPHLPQARRGESLSRKALWVLASTPGVSAVLVGMRHPGYVEDAMAILAWPPLREVRPIFEAIRQLRIR